MNIHFPLQQPSVAPWHRSSIKPLVRQRRDSGMLGAQMAWEPISKGALNDVLHEELAEATAEERALFAIAAVPPTKWQLSPWGDRGGGFWVVAEMGDRVLWYNDIEDGFNVASFVERGTIPSSEYKSNQDEIRLALKALAGKSET